MNLAQIFQVRQYLERVAPEFHTATELAEHAAQVFKLESELEDDDSPLWELALSCIKEVGP